MSLPGSKFVNMIWHAPAEGNSKPWRCSSTHLAKAEGSDAYCTDWNSDKLTGALADQQQAGPCTLQ